MSRKEEELTNRSFGLISTIQRLDNYTNLSYHDSFLSLAREFTSVIKEYNQLVGQLRCLVEDPAMLPEIESKEPLKWEN